jgi:tetratricopeptide (TPR) repeat protein
MSRSAKILIYTGLSLCALVFAWSFAVELTHLRQGAVDASKPKMVSALCGLIVVGVVLGFLCLSELSGKFGRRTRLWNLHGSDPDLLTAQMDASEKLRKKGEPLEAIGLLREYLKEHPHESEVMSRIAEIYNYDLRNYLAAALEYEEVLKQKLTDEDWGWAALHLAKLYGQLNRADDALTLLERLDTDYGDTLAARRARKVREQRSEGQAAEPPTDSPERNEG